MISFSRTLNYKIKKKKKRNLLMINGNISRKDNTDILIV